MSDIGVWHVTPTQPLKLAIDASTLDEVTQRLPDGYYSTFRTFGGSARVLGLRAHLQRLYEPVRTSEIDESFLRRQLFGLLEPYRPGEARVRAVMTKTGQAYLAIGPLPTLPREIYENGVRVETTEIQREQPQLKSTSFIGRSDEERKRIAEEGIFEALLVTAGLILEGMTSNFFYILGRNEVPPYIGTASADILPGITRQTVIDLARVRGLEVKYEPLKRDQVAEVREAFITSSSRGIVPVVRIDDVVIGQGNPGAITKELSAAYDQCVLERSESILPGESDHSG